MKKQQYYLLDIKVSGYLLIPVILLLLPADFFDNGQSLCLSQLIVGVSCYGCGMTRAIMHLIHLDFAATYEFNKLAFMAFPVLCFLWVQGFLKDFKTLKSYYVQNSGDCPTQH